MTKNSLLLSTPSTEFIVLEKCYSRFDNLIISVHVWSLSFLIKGNLILLTLVPK